MQDGGKISKSWADVNQYLIPKEDPHEVLSYRPILLLSLDDKKVVAILADRQAITQGWTGF